MIAVPCNAQGGWGPDQACGVCRAPKQNKKTLTCAALIPIVLPELLPEHGLVALAEPQAIDHDLHLLVRNGDLTAHGRAQGLRAQVRTKTADSKGCKLKLK
jgi:hypothetical protein